MIFRAFVNFNRKMSRLFDLLFPEKFRLSGGADFVENVVPMYLSEGQLIYDVGGGKRPFLSVEDKRKTKARVIGIDISREELDSAPKGAYDEKKQSSIENVVGNGDGDLVICNAVLEHVLDSKKSLASIFSLLRPGGTALIFVPSRNAVFARLNMLLHDSLKKKLLFIIYPKKSMSSGFVAYYDNCTPKLFSKIALECGFSVVEERCYYWSAYFSFFTPLYIIWRMWFIIFYSFAGKEASEGFVVVLRKQA